MGRCWKCDTELRLEGKQWLCDNCNKPIGYQCWNCGSDFTIRDEKTKKNIEECPSCGFYYCPLCQVCAEDCPTHVWLISIKEILSGQVTLEGSLILTKTEEKIRRIIKLIEEIKKENKPKKVCPYFVYSSYARGRKGEQGRIKQLLAKMNGIGTKSELDQEGFRRKLGKVININEGESFTIKQLREEGRYGQEERDACSLGICMGELNGKLTTTKDNNKAIVYTKIKNEGKCAYLRQDNYVTKRCPHCHRDYNNSKLEYYQPNIEECPQCIYKRGKKKDYHYRLIIQDTNTFTCNCPWEKFRVVEIREDEDGEEGN